MSARRCAPPRLAEELRVSRGRNPQPRLARLPGRLLRFSRRRLPRAHRLHCDTSQAGRAGMVRHGQPRAPFSGIDRCRAARRVAPRSVESLPLAGAPISIGSMVSTPVSADGAARTRICWFACCIADYAARMGALPPASFTSGMPRPTVRNWPPMTRVSRPYCTATTPARNVAYRRCAQPPWPEKMTAKTTIMPPRNLESNAMAAAVRAPRLGQIADGLAAAVAVSLPWSTSATSILIVLWIIAVVPTLDVPSVRREVLSAAGGLPVLLWILGAIGMLWADVSWSERMAGLSGFHKLMLIPLLLAQFR